MTTNRRLHWRDMDHDREPLLQEIVRANRTERRGPIPEFLAKKRPEQAPKTARWYSQVLADFMGFLESRGRGTMGDLTEEAGHEYIVRLRDRGLGENTINNYVRALKVFTAWMRRRGWPREDRFEDVRPPRFP